MLPCLFLLLCLVVGFSLNDTNRLNTQRANTITIRSNPPEQSLYFKSKLTAKKPRDSIRHPHWSNRVTQVLIMFRQCQRRKSQPTSANSGSRIGSEYRKM
jgi:hypothetical protein